MSKNQIFNNTFTGERGYFGGSTPVDTGRSLDAFLEATKFDYDVHKVQAVHPYKRDDSDKLVVIPNQFHLINGNTDEVLSPMTVSDQYGVISPRNIVESTRHLVDDGWATPDSLMRIRGGQSEVLMLRLDGQTPAIKNNGVEEDWVWYLMIQNFHGRGKCRARIIAKRPVCSNQIAGLMADFDWAVSHRKNAAEKFENKVQTWENLQNRLTVIAKKMGLYADTTVDIPAVAREIVGIKSPEVGKTEAESNSTRKMNLLSAIIDGANMPNLGTFGRSAMDVYNSVTSFNTRGHEAVRSKLDAGQRAVRLIEGAGMSGHGLEMKTHKVLAGLVTA